MEKHNRTSLGNIKKFSGIAYKVLGIVVIVYTVAAVLAVIAEIWLFAGGNVDVVSLRPLALDIYMLRWDNASVFIPVAPNIVTSFTVANAYTHLSPGAALAVVLAVSVIGGLMVIGGMLYLRHIFKELKIGVSPFAPAMVNRFLYVVIFITLNALISNPSLANIILAGFMWLMYYVFDHGRKLQEESDTTL